MLHVGAGNHVVVRANRAGAAERMATRGSRSIAAGLSLCFSHHQRTGKHDPCQRRSHCKAVSECSQRDLSVLYLMYSGLLEPGGEQSLNLHRLGALEHYGARTLVAAQESKRALTMCGREVLLARLSEAIVSAVIRFYERHVAFPEAMVADLRRAFLTDPIDIVIFTQARNLLAASRLWRLTQAAVLGDCRAGPDERLWDAGSPVRRAKDALFRWAYRPAARLAHHVLSVSQKLSDQMAERYGCPEERITVCPNGTDTEVFRLDAEVRSEVRGSLGVADTDLVVVFRGAITAWQCIAEGLSLFKLMAARATGAHLLLITPHGEEARRLLSDSPAKRASTAIGLTHDQVPRYLAPADVGLLLRRRGPRNSTASPVKFAEYLACGLPVAIGSELGDYTDLMNVAQRSNGRHSSESEEMPEERRSRNVTSWRARP